MEVSEEMMESMAPLSEYWIGNMFDSWTPLLATPLTSLATTSLALPTPRHIKTCIESAYKTCVCATKSYLSKPRNVSYTAKHCLRILELHDVLVIASYSAS